MGKKHKGGKLSFFLFNNHGVIIRFGKFIIVIILNILFIFEFHQLSPIPSFGN